MAPEGRADSYSRAPDSFTRAVTAMRSVETRPEIRLADAAPPGNLAPYSVAIGGTVTRDGDEVATGRLILLCDPAGHDAWAGTMRLVTYVTAEVDAEMAADPLLAAVAWSWLTDALEAHGAAYRSPGGTVTITTSSKFGDLAGPSNTADLEIRASWSPADDRYADHMHAWCSLLASTAGLPPPGVTALSSRGASPGA